MDGVARQERRRTVAAIGAITVVAAVLRLFAARGGLWLDEAWSALAAHQVGTPAGVFLSINHDNNHHLNSLWLQAVGADAPPVLQRLLSIVTSTATIPVAAAIAGRRSVAAAILAALLFGFAPFLVTYGSEARGYAPMLLAWTVAIGVTDRWLGDPAAAPRRTALALAALLGCMAQATMTFGLVALAAWVAIDRAQAAGARRAVGDGIRLFLPAALVTAAFGGLLLWAASRDPAGFRFGSREAHDWATWGGALDQLVKWSLGTPLAAAVVALFGLRVRDRIGGLALTAGIGVPLAVALLALPNSSMARYYAVAVPPLLLWTAIALPVVARVGTGWRVAAAAVLAVFVAGAAVRDAALVRQLRGDPTRAITTLAVLAPQGTTVSIERARSTAILFSAAATTGYHVRIVEAPCPAAPFRFVERDFEQPFEPVPVACGHRYREIARGDPDGMSGSHWRLYRRLP